jgi:cytochrome c peroxidase
MAAAFYPSRETIPEQEVARWLCNEISAFDSFLAGPFMEAVRHDKGQAELQQLFLQARSSYKRWEWAAEYFNPLLARKLNGPPVPEADPQVASDATAQDYDPGRYRVTQPEGLQVIEAILFPNYDTASKQTLLSYLSLLRHAAQEYKQRFELVEIVPGQVLDAAKLEIFRLETLGIVGFDDPLSLHSLEESAAALEGLQTALQKYAEHPGNRHVPSFDSLTYLFTAATALLKGHTAFDSFDRAAFITHYGAPLSKVLSRLADEWKIPVIRYNRLLRQEATTLFDTDAFDADAYLPDEGHLTTAALVRLGKRLFYEPALSATGKRSCASCHQPQLAFADGLAVNTSLDGHGLLARNTPTLLNAAFQSALFYDLRSPTLEKQLQDVLHNSKEMQASLHAAVPQLLADSGYQRLFMTAFPKDVQSMSDTSWIVSALAAYVRSLVKLNSRFDDYMRGDSTALNTQELKGFNLFMGKARCGTCHYMPLFNGNFPPLYTRMEAEVIGIPVSPEGHILDPDPGRFDIVMAPFLLHAFKTPTVRDAARTAPYMHNGAFNTLEQVVDFYNNGGGKGEGETVTNQTLSSDSLHLSPVEKNALIAFIKSLDSQ